jgi:hypothetical protein
VSVALLLVANVVAIAADRSVMADALQLLVGGPHLLYVLLFGAFCVATRIFMRYTRYAAVLKWRTLSFHRRIMRSVAKRATISDRRAILASAVAICRSAPYEFGMFPAAARHLLAKLGVGVLLFSGRERSEARRRGSPPRLYGTVYSQQGRAPW